ncbi:hypothetical protein T09_6780 [Trichinella sp. T9]|nr:hypothetical protein T09_6780 [Trichinella sp. T9]
MQVPDKTKLGTYWDGPYEVQKKLDWNTYRLKEMKGRRQRLVVHFDRLKLVPSSQQAASAKLSVNIAVRRELFPPASPRDIPWDELKRRFLDIYGRQAN